jgi:uncharacterized protein (TIGR02569 family)
MCGDSGGHDRGTHRTFVGAEVLAAFGLPADVAVTPVGRCVRAGSVILKPVDLVAEAEWVASISTWLGGDGFRVARPVPAVRGWTHDGWAAWQVVPGEHAPRWDDVLAVSRHLHRALADLTRPAFLDRREDRWSVADRMAFGERPLDGVPPDVVRLVEPLVARLEPIDLPSQVVHGDLGGNVLFADGLPPAVIDLTPYWRPAGFADAVVVVDAVVWGGGDLRLLRRVEHQLLLRAALRRILEAPGTAAAHAGLVDRLVLP